MRNYNTEIPYREECPAMKDMPYRYQRKHKWKTVKGSEKPHPEKRGMLVNNERCEHCKEVTRGEHFLI
jgi:hypothetical protein